MDNARYNKYYCSNCGYSIQLVNADNSIMPKLLQCFRCSAKTFMDIKSASYKLILLGRQHRLGKIKKGDKK